ncbi:MAG: hypothetical protein CM1200mP30_31500 [Pseudomonadota bacterium]|nr:MAG: hypothetical protein CM1200mP30_31500 [Pseudomonadota bacterium]
MTLPDLFENFDPLMVRYFIAASHYRSVVDFNENVLRSAAVSLKRLHQTVQKLREQKPEEAKSSGKNLKNSAGVSARQWMMISQHRRH